jgi:hypothetical protein
MKGGNEMGGALKGKEELKVVIEIRGRVDVVADFNKELGKLVQKYGAKVKEVKGKKRRPK